MKLVALFVLLVVAGCQSVPSWERGVLARSDMQLEGSPTEALLNSQLYDSKEASAGGLSAAGAGCGCN